MGELYYPRPITSIFQNSPSLIFFFYLSLYYIYCGQSNFEFEYLGEFETEFENILGYKSGAQVCSFDGKKRRSKISCYCPFNVVVGAHLCMLMGQLYYEVPTSYQRPLAEASDGIRYSGPRVGQKAFGSYCM